MKARRTDLIAATLLLVFAIAWSVTVYQTVPTSSDEIGPRAFPLILGITLIVLSALMLLRALGSSDAATETEIDDQTDNPEFAGGGKFAVGLFLLIILYGFLIERTGFLLATPIVIIGAVAGLLRLRNPLVILALAAGITAGCWLIFHKMLGIYMPPGSWISITI
ncbi:MAG TPA: tripartite tricarboxylate transporter TctB family protein [Hyphomicrobiales bacterium]|nr:tripartite tricarboxylate transporter TctB family protein [Hyphomicrobiales bacterium]